MRASLYRCKEHANNRQSHAADHNPDDHRSGPFPSGTRQGTKSSMPILQTWGFGFEAPHKAPPSGYSQAYAAVFRMSWFTSALPTFRFDCGVDQTRRGGGPLRLRGIDQRRMSQPTIMANPTNHNRRPSSQYVQVIFSAELGKTKSVEMTNVTKPAIPIRSMHGFILTSATRLEPAACKRAPVFRWPGLVETVPGQIGSGR